MSNQRKFSPGHIGLILAVLVGVWLIISPTWVGFTAHRRIDEWAGAVVLTIAVVTGFMQWAFGIKEVVQQHSEES